MIGNLTRLILTLAICVTTHTFFFFFFSNLTYSRWTSSLPSCMWSLRIFPSLPGSRLTIFYRDASSALLQLVNQWLNFTYSRSHAFRYERTNINPTLVRIELTTRTSRCADYLLDNPVIYGVANPVRGSAGQEKSTKLQRDHKKLKQGKKQKPQKEYGRNERKHIRARP